MTLLSLRVASCKDVAKMGISAYNNECRKIVMRYANEWEQVVNRMGRWIDFRNDYKTLYPWFMESIWWVFHQLFAKGLVYQGVKVMPYSTACTTALSNVRQRNYFIAYFVVCSHLYCVHLRLFDDFFNFQFESGQNYKEVVDPAVIVGFPVINSSEFKGVQLLAWTTTPWTLPSNLSLCVNPEMTYLRIKELPTGAEYILAESRVESLFKDASKYEIVGKFNGRTLENLKYEPLFDYFGDYSKKMNAHRVVCDGYVTEDSGVGVVHQAPYFGEDDYRVCLANGIIQKDSEVICPVDESGRFVDPVTDFKGQYVKDADKNIIAYLKAKGRLVQSSQVKHSYPYCWRSDTPLIYKGIILIFFFSVLLFEFFFFKLSNSGSVLVHPCRTNVSATVDMLIANLLGSRFRKG